MSLYGPAHPGEIGAYVPVHEGDDGVNVNYVEYCDGRLYEASWPVGTHGTRVVEAIQLVPARAVSDGREWENDEDDIRTYAAFWQAF